MHTSSPSTPTQRTRRTIWSALEAHATVTPDAIAIAAPGRVPLTYGRLRSHVLDTLRTLDRMGFGPGSRVAIALPNGPDLATAFLAVAAGLAAAPLNPTCGEPELERDLAHLRIDALLVPAGADTPAKRAARKLGKPIVETASDEVEPAGLFRLLEVERTAAAGGGAIPIFGVPADVALLLQTSGTTSRAKVVPLTQANVCSAASTICGILGLSPDDRCLNPLPLFHVHGLVAGLLAPLASGGSVVCPPRFDPERFFGWLDEGRPTWYTAVPTMHRAILDRAPEHEETIRRCPLRFIRSGSASLHPRVMAELEEVFRAPAIESYGMTEAATQIASNPLPPGRRKPGSAGLAIGPEVRIVDAAGRSLPTGEVGEVAIRGANVTGGYEGDPEANARAFVDGWLRTGDQGYFDGDGYLFLTGRIKEIINRGGEKICPREVDEVLLDHPAVVHACAFAVPHPRLGEDVAAAVVLREGAAATPGEIRSFIAGQIAPFKVPGRVLVVADLPKGPTGKVQRIGMAERLGLGGDASLAAGAAYAPPRTPIEETICEAWQQVLKVERVGIHDDFLDLGGDSIGATQVVARLREALGVRLDLRDFLEAPTVAELAERAAAALVEEGATDDEVVRLLAELEALSEDQDQARPSADGSPDSSRGATEWPV